MQTALDQIWRTHVSVEESGFDDASEALRLRAAYDAQSCGGRPVTI